MGNAIENAYYDVTGQQRPLTPAQQARRTRRKCDRLMETLQEQIDAANAEADKHHANLLLRSRRGDTHAALAMEAKQEITQRSLALRYMSTRGRVSALREKVVDTSSAAQLMQIAQDVAKIMTRVSASMPTQRIVATAAALDKASQHMEMKQDAISDAIDGSLDGGDNESGETIEEQTELLISKALDEVQLETKFASVPQVASATTTALAPTTNETKVVVVPAVEESKRPRMSGLAHTGTTITTEDKEPDDDVDEDKTGSEQVKS